MPWWDEDQTPQLLQKPQESFGPDGDYFGPEGAALYKQRLDAYNAQQAALAAAMPKLKSKEDFMATIKPGMLDEQGRFKGPQAGVNYIFEGMTPDDVYSRFSSPSQPKSIDGDEGDTSSLSYWQNKLNAINGVNATLDAGWREGPDNGGGFIGGLGRSAKSVLSIPPISMALTAGMAPMLGEAIGSATGMGEAASNIAAKGIINGARTLATGGNLGDVAKNAALSYAGSQVGDVVGDSVNSATDSPLAARIASDIAKSAITGGNVASSLLSSGANAVLREITDAVPGFGDLTDAQKGIINSAIAASLKGKNVTPALISNIISGATAQVTKVKQHSGWS